MKRMEWIMAAVAVVLAFIAYWQGGSDLAWKGVRAGAASLKTAAALIVLTFVITGLMQVILAPELIKKWLGREAGLRGLALGTAVGALTPGGPYVYYPVALALQRAGAGPGTILAYITAKSLWDVSRIPLELAFLGPFVTLVRWVVTCFAPPVVGLAGERLFTAMTTDSPEAEAK